jgi:hypothetical protein
MVRNYGNARLTAEGAKDAEARSQYRCRRASWLAACVLTAAHALLAADIAAAQSVSASERDALVRLHAERGGKADEVDALIRHADGAAAKGLPVPALTNKIREGLAKGVAPQRIELVIQRMVLDLDTADRLLRGMEPAPSKTGLEGAVTLLGDSLTAGVTPDEVRELARQTQASAKPALTPDALAGAAKALSLIKEARLPVADGTAVIVEAVRQGFRWQQILDLGREVKRREVDYRAGRASLAALRDAIARGERPEQLLRDSRASTVERPAATRPETTPDRPERQVRPETPQRPARPERPERPADRVRQR